MREENHSGASRGVEVGTASRLAILGHPVHAMVVMFPIAFLTGALATDLAYWGTDDLFWARASHWLLGTGVVMAAAAALAGLVDFLTIRQVRRLREAWAHFLGNAALIVLALANYLLRLDDQAGAILPVGLLLSALTAAGLTVTGHLGGRVAHNRLIGVRGVPVYDEHEARGPRAGGQRQDDPRGGQRPGDVGGGPRPEDAAEPGSRRAA